MIVFRLVCALLLAWAVSWAFGQEEAAVLLAEFPEMELIGILVAIWVGAFSLATRQGWGMIVAVANGAWAGVLTVALSGGVFLIVLMLRNVGVVGSFRRWLEVFESDSEPLFEQMTNLALFLKTLAAAVVVGIVTEAIHWALVRIRRARGEPEPDRGVTTQRQNPRDLW
ncbi:MAG TPA: hypothetical protein VMM55_08815 [Thermohalobaculum sp.]|nr:hypothetical protein [Thermohalobaculum sp.]